MTASPEKESRLETLQLRWIVFGLLTPLHALLLVWLACCHSPTSDEVAHLAAGVRLWTTGRCDVYPVNPPLVKAVATFPVMLRGPQTDWHRMDDRPGARPEWNLGTDFMFANMPDVRWDFVIARWMCLPFCLLGLAYCYWWSETLFGARSGAFAASLWTFSPAILGNGSLMTPDVAAASLGMAALFHFRCWAMQHRWSQALLTGILLGLAQLTKMTWLILYPLLPALWAWNVWYARSVRAESQTEASQPRFGLQLLQLGLLLFVSLDVLNAGYLFEGSMKPLKEFQFVSTLLAGHSEDRLTANRFAQSWLGEIPVPFPESYVTGIDLQRRDFEGTGLPMVSYMYGELRSHGWWYYYLYAFLVKSPTGLLMLTGLALMAVIRCRDSKSRIPLCEWGFLLIPAAALFCFVSSQTGFSRYARYALPCVPLLFIAVSVVVSPGVRTRCPKIPVMACCALILFVCESMAVIPHSLSFFNVLSGGPMRGHWHLLDSNIDWGQDLHFLKSWMKQNPESRPVYLSYSGVVPPELFNAETQPVPVRHSASSAEFPAGWYAISVNHLHGYDAAPDWCRHFLHQVPIGRAGYSIMIYRIDSSTEEQE